MKLTTVHNDLRFNDSDFRETCGSFSVILFTLEKGLRELGYFTDKIDEADWVISADSLAVDFNIEGKRCVQINFQDLVNTIPLIAVNRKRNNPYLKLVSLNQHTADLWNKYNVPCNVIGPAIDCDYWKPTDCKNRDKFTYIFSSFSNIRSGLDLLLRAWNITFANDKKVQLIIKNTSDSIVLEKYIKSINTGNITYINKRLKFSQLRDLYSTCHVNVSVFRHSGHGLIIGESAALQNLNIVGDFDPSNKIADSRFARFLKPCAEIEINSIRESLVRNYGLTDTFAGLEWGAPPRFYDYNISDYGDLLRNVYENYEDYSQYNMHEAIKEKWNMIDSAKKLIKALQES